MARRQVAAFNLSFLDLLSGALGAIIFLFVIVPKGGGASAPTKTIQATLQLDTLHRQVWGSIVDSLANKKIGDTLLVIVTDYGIMEQVKECPECPTCPPNRPCPACPQCPPASSPAAVASTPAQQVTPVVTSKPVPAATTTAPVTKPVAANNSSSSNAYRGLKPSNPCKVAFEISWDSADDNVDLFVYKGSQFVSGASGKRNNSQIGEWDSGRSKTKLFSNDFRTDQEAVRQFKKILPGEYRMYARFKETNPKQPRQSIQIKGLLYTKNEQGKEEGREFSTTIPLSRRSPSDSINDKKLVATVNLREDGTFSFQQN